MVYSALLSLRLRARIRTHIRARARNCIIQLIKVDNFCKKYKISPQFRAPQSKNEEGSMRWAAQWERQCPLITPKRREKIAPIRHKMSLNFARFAPLIFTKLRPQDWLPKIRKTLKTSPIGPIFEVPFRHRWRFSITKNDFFTRNWSFYHREI